MRIAIVALLSLSLAGCGEGSTNILRQNVNYFPTAEQNYQAGVKELDNKNWMSAIQYFTHVKNNFGFSKWATLAELGTADANLGREKFTEAIDGYKAFIKAHPMHEHVTDGYCSFKIGEAYYKQIPSDWFMAPPSYEKDQGPVLDALRELQAFVDDEPNSPYTPKARNLIGDCIRRLADHELYVAQFYLDRDKPYAAIGRLEGVLRDYPGAKREPETLLLLGKTYLKMEKPKEAREVFEKLKDDHPDDYRAAKAKLYIQFIDKKLGPKS